MPPRTTRITCVGALLVVALLAAGCGPGSVAEDELAALADDPSAALEALSDADTAGPLLTGGGVHDLTEAVIVAAFDGARTDPDDTISSYVEVTDLTADLLDGRARLNPGAARGLAHATAWHMDPLAAHFAPGSGNVVPITVTSLGPVLRAIAAEPLAANRLAEALGVLHVVNFGVVADTIQERDDLIDISGADQSGWLSGLFEVALGTAAGGTTHDVNWEAVVAGADGAVDIAAADPDAFSGLTVAAILDAIETDTSPDSDDPATPAITWDRQTYAAATAAATFVALEVLFADADTDVTVDDDTRRAYRATGRIHASLSDPDVATAPTIAPISEPARVLVSAWRNFCAGPCLDD